jgi:hypothetical protein
MTGNLGHMSRNAQSNEQTPGGMQRPAQQREPDMHKRIMAIAAFRYPDPGPCSSAPGYPGLCIGVSCSSLCLPPTWPSWPTPPLLLGPWFSFFWLVPAPPGPWFELLNGREENCSGRYATLGDGSGSLRSLHHLHFVCQTDADRWPSTPVMRANRSCDSASGGLAISQALHYTGTGIVGLHPRLLHPATVASLPLPLLTSPGFVFLGPYFF